jgi:hypothetical protein
MKIFVLVFLLSLSGGCISVHAQARLKLTIEGDKFCINSQAKFFVFASYFDALDAAYLQSDLNYLQAHCISGIRIFPNWWGNQTYSNHTLFDSLGHIRPERMKRLKSVLEAAQAHGMIVDITFTHETVKGLDIAHYKKGIVRTVSKLKSYKYILYDLQNERNGQRTYLSEKDIIALRGVLKSIQPGVILSASEAYEATPGEDSGFVSRTGMDVINYHEPRGGKWWNRTYSRAEELRTTGKPVYLGEPGRWKPGSSLTAADLIRAITEAKKAGAAAWTFHSEASFYLDHTSLLSNLNPLVEQGFLDSLPAILQRTKWGDN